MRILGLIEVDIAPDKLVNAPRNANSFDPAKFEQFKTAIALEGFLQPIIVRVHVHADGGVTVYMIVDGHHRVRAVRELNDQAWKNYQASGDPEEAAGFAWKVIHKLPAVLVECTDAEAEAVALGMQRYRGDINLHTAAFIVADIASQLDPERLMAMTGFSSGEVEALVASVQTQVETDMPAAMESLPDEEESALPKPFILEIEFANKADLQLAKRRLRRAAGKGGELSTGLLRVLGEEQ